MTGGGDAVFDFVESILKRQPFSDLIGARLVSADAQESVLALDLENHHLQQHGFAHGGVVSYLADNAITIAGGLALAGDALTLEFKINYVRPAIGQSLIARAAAKATGKRQSVCTCDVFAVAEGSEKLCAVAQGTVVRAG